MANPDGTSDRNVWSLWGREDFGTIIVEGDLHPHRDERGNIISHDTVKVSNCRRGKIIIRGSVYGSIEDAFDLMACEDVEIVVEGIVHANGCRQFITFKGKSRNCTIRARVKGQPTVVGVDCGNIADQTDDNSGILFVDLTHVDGATITYRRLAADEPIFMNRAVQRYRRIFALPLWLRSAFSKGYKFLKHCGLPI